MAKSKVRMGVNMRTTGIVEGTHDDELKFKASRLRNAYSRCKNRKHRMISGVEGNYGLKRYEPWDGDTSTAIRKTLWGRLALTLENQHCDNLEGYIYAQFIYGNDLPPNSLHGPYALANYVKYCNEIKDILYQERIVDEEQFRCETFKLSTRYANEATRGIWFSVLNDHHNMLSSLFRYCIAVYERFSEIQTKYKLFAWEQFYLDPVSYCNTWNDLLPDFMNDKSNWFEHLLLAKEL